MDEHSSGEELANILKDRNPYASSLHRKVREKTNTKADESLIDEYIKIELLQKCTNVHNRQNKLKECQK